MRISIMRAGWLILACVFLNIPSHAQDIRAGYKRSKPCAICHGWDGLAVAANTPNLAGENALYIAAQLRAFRDGKRQHEQMSLIARDLADQDIANLALWYSKITVKATLPNID